VTRRRFLFGLFIFWLGWDLGRREWLLAGLMLVALLAYLAREDNPTW
jgi:hypothetical protein